MPRFLVLSLPSIFSGPDNLANLKKLAQQYQEQSEISRSTPATIPEEDDDEIPDLVEGEDFEAASKKVG